jgi:hypothetical protein
MRADGMGWGQIAHTLGTKLGPIVASMKSGNTYLATRVPNQASTRTASTSATATNISGGSKAGSGMTTMGGTFRGVSSHVGGKGGDVSGARFSNQYYLAHRSRIVTAADGPAGGVYSSYCSSGNGQGHAYGLGVPKSAGSEVAMGGAVSNGGGNAGGNGKGLGHYQIATGFNIDDAGIERISAISVFT